MCTIAIRVRVTCLLGICLWLHVLLPSALAQIECGDCNGSGALPPTVLDALVAAQMGAGLIVPSAPESCACDVDGSGSVGVLDALRMAQAAAGLPAVLVCPAPLCGSPLIVPVSCGTPHSSVIAFGDPATDFGTIAYSEHLVLQVIPVGTTSIELAITSGTGDLDLHIGAPGTIPGDPSPASYVLSSATPSTSLETITIDAASTPDLAAFGGGPITMVIHARQPGSFTFAATCSSLVALPPVFAALPTGPPARVFATGVLDSNRERVIVFGGFDGSPRNDTWAFDLVSNTWSQLTPSGSPPPGTDGVAAIFDPAGDRMIFRGGSATATSTWQLSFTVSANGAWSMLSAAGGSPPYRIYGAAIHDPVALRMLVYGGGGAYLGDLWQLTLTPGSETWTELFPAGGPTVPSSDHSALYDSVRHRMIIHAGSTGAGISNRVFAIDLTTGPAGTWSELMPSPAGLARWHQSAVFDPVGDRMFVTGGIEPSFSPPHYDDIAQFAFSTIAWSDVSPVTRPTGRYGAVLVADLARRRAILYGGTAGSYGPGVLSDTWAMNF